MNKQCSTCGRIHDKIPEDARPWIDHGYLLGYVWECVCGSTLFKKTESLVCPKCGSMSKYGGTCADCKRAGKTSYE